jgi:long-chain acyl-CoA synthetase
MNTDPPDLHWQPASAPLDFHSNRSLVDVLEQSCQRFARRPAFHNLGTTLTYSDLERLTRHFAAYLQSRGLNKGDRIALMMPNLLQYPVALFGALRAGLIVVNTNPMYTARELRTQLRDSGARAVVVLENVAHVLEDVRQDTEVEQVVTTAVGDLLPVSKRVAVNFVVRHVRHRVPDYDLPGAVNLRRALAQGSDRDFERRAVGPEDIAFLQYTGGTTGVPKGAILTHRNMVANLSQMGAVWGNVLAPSEEIIITPLPLYHVFCLTCNCLLFMQLGGLNVLITDPRDIPGFVRELARWKFSMISGVTTLYSALLAHPDFARLDFSHLKFGAAGGMSLHPSVVERWRAITGHPLVEGYGLTEASPVVACNSYNEPWTGTVGRPLPATEIRIQDSGVEVPRGEPGELWVRGPQVMRGYWNRPEETAEVLTEEGWLRTGDVAVLEPDGALRIVDRKKDMIIVSGFKVFPNEIEAVVSAHPAVLECGCIGVPDERSGQAVAVFVALRPAQQLSEAELIQFCRDRLTAYKMPKHVEFRVSLPKTNVGKVLRRELSAAA